MYTMCIGIESGLDKLQAAPLICMASMLQIPNNQLGHYVPNSKTDNSVIRSKSDNTM